MAQTHRETDSPGSHEEAIVFWFVWGDRRRLRGMVDGVSPLTWRGTRNVAAWLAGLAVIASVCIRVLPGPRPVWFLVALAVMVLVGRWWDRRDRDAVDQSSVEP